MSQNFNPNAKVFDLKEHEERIDRILAKTFNYSCMSNSKWRKCFQVLDQFGEEKSSEYGRAPRSFQVMWKFVGNRENTVVYTTPHKESLLEKYIDSRFWYGPLFYKEIEWIEALRVVKPKGKEQYPTTHYTQDLDTVESALLRVGKFELETTDLGLRLYGYR